MSLRCGIGIAKARNDGRHEGGSVVRGGDGKIDNDCAVDLPIRQDTAKRFAVQSIHSSEASILDNLPGDQKSSLVGREPLGLLRPISDDEKKNDAETDGHNAFNDVDPTPGGEAANASEIGHAIRNKLE